MSADHSSKAVPSHQDNGVAYTDAGNFDLTTVYIAFQRQGNGVAYTDAGNFDSTNCIYCVSPPQSLLYSTRLQPVRIQHPRWRPGVAGSLTAY